jgi:riboflavin transporter FmnP
VKFSLAPAQSEHQEGIRIFGSWGLTKGRYFRTAAAYLLAVLSLVPIYAAATLINVGVAVAMGASLDDGIAAVMRPDWSNESILSPSVLVYVLVNSVVVAVAWIVCLASSATVYAKVVGIAHDKHGQG